MPLPAGWHEFGKGRLFPFYLFCVMKFSGNRLFFLFPILVACTGQGSSIDTDQTTVIQQTAPDSSATSSKPDTPATTAVPHTTIKPLAGIRYTAFRFKDSGRARMKAYTPEEKKVIYTINRIDGAHISNLDTVIVPEKFPGDLREISPFPLEVPALREVKKIVLFSYPIQAFAAYENGVLDIWGPTSMGRKSKQTPEGLYFANWKAKETISTVSDEWKLKWNFNIQNKQGIGWHQYGLPGIPASHSCLRLLESDAQWLYDWADMWVLKNPQELAAQGTPTIVFGQYPWGSRRPWRAVLEDPHANDLSVSEVEAIVKPHLQKILDAQQKRENVVASSGK